jgi:hypothetical protein
VDGAVTVKQHTANYVEGPEGHWYVQWNGDLPHIWIVQPWNPAWGPLSFECCDDVTGEPAAIEAITPAPSLQGDVHFEVREGEGHSFGAADVYLLDFDQAGVTSTAEYVNIQYSLGAAGPTYITSVDEDEYALFYAYDMESDVEVGEVSETATVHFVHLQGHTLHVAGSAPGFLLVGQ